MQELMSRTPELSGMDDTSCKVRWAQSQWPRSFPDNLNLAARAVEHDAFGNASRGVARARAFVPAEIPVEVFDEESCACRSARRGVNARRRPRHRSAEARHEQQRRLGL